MSAIMNLSSGRTPPPYQRQSHSADSARKILAASQTNIYRRGVSPDAFRVIDFCADKRRSPGAKWFARWRTPRHMCVILQGITIKYHQRISISSSCDASETKHPVEQSQCSDNHIWPSLRESEAGLLENWAQSVINPFTLYGWKTLTLVWRLFCHHTVQTRTHQYVFYPPSLQFSLGVHILRQGLLALDFSG
jgi:hypothetical protein